MKFVFTALLAACAFAACSADVLVQEEEPVLPPRPYSFNIRAGRFPGNVDRQHVESSDGSGVVRGSYSYIGPRQQIRTVDYVADAHGFHPLVHNPVEDTPAVAHAKLAHAELFARIAADHARIGEERAAQAHAQGVQQYRDY